MGAGILSRRTCAHTDPCAAAAALLLPARATPSLGMSALRAPEFGRQGCRGSPGRLRCSNCRSEALFYAALEVRAEGRILQDFCNFAGKAGIIRDPPRRCGRSRRRCGRSRRRLALQYCTFLRRGLLLRLLRRRSLESRVHRCSAQCVLHSGGRNRRGGLACSRSCRARGSRGGPDRLARSAPRTQHAAHESEAQPAGTCSARRLAAAGCTAMDHDRRRRRWPFANRLRHCRR